MAVGLEWTEETGWAEAQRRIAHCRETHAEALDLGGLRLGRVPEEVLAIGWLKRLNFGIEPVVINPMDSYGIWHARECRWQSRNKLSTFPDGFAAALLELTSLDLRYNQIALAGAAHLAGLTTLTSLDLSGNEIGPGGAAYLAGLNRLTSLSLHSCRIGPAGSAHLAGLTALTSLDLENNEMGPTGAAHLAGLIALNLLNLGGNQIGPDGAGHLVGLSALTSLDLTANELGPTGAAHLAGLTALTSLYLGDNKIGDAGTAHLAGLTALTSLNLAGNRIGDAGMKALSGLVNLSSLNVERNQIGDEGAEALGTITNLTHLDLSDNEIGPLGAQALANLQKLTHLNLASGNRIEAFGAQALSGLTGLTVLNLHYNQIYSAGALALAGLANLTHLVASNCFIGAEGAKALSGLVKLTHLNLSDNRIGDDGAAHLAGLAKLNSLGLDYNKIGDPGVAHLAGLTGLTALDLSGNDFANVAPLVGLPQLAVLSLNRCQIDHETAALWLKPSLQRVSLRDGSIRGVPPEILGDDCLPRLRAHMTDLLASDRDGGGGGHAVEDVKLMILGNGTAGKTQIVRRLSGQPFDESVPSTHGIQVSAAPLAPDDDGNSITLRIWDFGGQDIYHGTHALFLKTRAVFPIVWSTDTLDGEHDRHGRFRNYPLDYWLAYVKELGGRQSPVLMVQAKVDTQAERRPLPLPDDWTNGLDWHTSLDSSAAKPRGIEKLKLELTDAVHWLRSTHGVMQIGGGRAAVKAEIEARAKAGQQTMTLDEFEALCAADGRISSPQRLLEFLHNIGTVFYRKGLFGDLIILDQQWALRAVYAVFDREKSWRQLQLAHGRFTRTLLGALVWDAAGHSETDQAQFIEFMRASGMCFELRKEAEGFEAEYIAPDLLPGRDDPEVAAKLAWHDPARIDASGRMTFAMLPQGLLRTVMAAVGDKAGRAGTYWRDGFAFYDADTKARVLVAQEIKSDWSGEITIEAHGGDAATLLQRVLTLIQDRTEKFGARATSVTTSLDHGLEREGDKRYIDLDLIPAGAKFTDYLRAALEPVDAFRIVHAPSEVPRYYVSYTWGDETDEGSIREAAVDRFCAEAERQHTKVIRDKEAMKLGDQIPRFMDQLIGADQVFVFLSDKYLKSRYCMYELLGIWRECRERGDEFTRRAKFFVFDSARFHSVADVNAYAEYWRQQDDQLWSEIASDRENLTEMRTFWRLQYAKYRAEIRPILEFIASVRYSRSLDEFVALALGDAAKARK